jgi:hypothetical protein
MAAPIILPPLRDADFDLIWFAVVMTVAMENGPYPSPVGLNIFVFEHRARHPLAGRDPWGAAIRPADRIGCRDALSRSLNLHLVAQSGDGAAYP